MDINITLLNAMKLIDINSGARTIRSRESRTSTDDISLISIVREGRPCHVKDM